MSDPEKEAAKADPLTQRKVNKLLKEYHGAGGVTFDSFFDSKWGQYKDQSEFSTFNDFLNEELGYMLFETVQMRKGNIDPANIDEDWKALPEDRKKIYIDKVKGGKTRRTNTSRRRKTRSRRVRK
jgi:hypothetical protein